MLPLLPMPIRLCCFDVDETLVGSWGRAARQLAPSLAEALESCRRQSIGLGLATGRSYRSARPYVELVQASAPLILYNGARVQEPGTGRVLFERSLDLGAALRVLGLVKRHGLHLNLYMDEHIYIEEETPVSRESAIKDGVLQEPVGDLPAFLDRSPTKLLIIGPGPRLEALQRDLDSMLDENEAEVVRSEPTYLEVLPARVSKGAALVEVSRMVRVPLDEIAAFGDSDNDIEMLRQAGLGVAVANAKEHVRAEADYVSVSERGLGVAEALQRLVLERM